MREDVSVFPPFRENGVSWYELKLEWMSSTRNSVLAVRA